MHKDTSNTNPEGNKSPAIDYFIVLFGSILILTIVLTIVINQEWSERVIQNTFNFITSRDFNHFNFFHLNNFFNPSEDASQTPFSVISLVTYFAGVTSKAKFIALLFLG